MNIWLKQLIILGFVCFVQAGYGMQRMTHKEAYEILEIQENNVNEEVVKAVFKKLALRYHPDKCSLHGYSKEEGEELFNQLKTACEVLLGKDKTESFESEFINEVSKSFGGQKTVSRKELIATETFLGFPIYNVYNNIRYEKVGSEMAYTYFTYEDLPAAKYINPIRKYFPWICFFGIALWSEYKYNFVSKTFNKFIKT